MGGGWVESAEAWTDFVDQGDPNRTHLLDPLMLKLCGDVGGLRVLDVGCGEGRFARMLTQRGAKVVGFDPTAALLQLGWQRGCKGLLRAVAEAIPLRSSTFDVAASYVTLVDIPGYREAICEMARVLKPGGRLVLSNVSAFATANGRWILDDQGRKARYSFDRYAEEFSESCAWRGIEVLQYHRPLGKVMEACLDAGLRLEHFSEPLPSPETVEQFPGLGDFTRMPNFYVMAWRKEA